MGTLIPRTAFRANHHLPFPLTEMLDSNNLITFNGLANSSSYHTFLLDEERGRLVVGAKDHIFSFNLVNINKDYPKVTLLQSGGVFGVKQSQMEEHSYYSIARSF